MKTQEGCFIFTHDGQKFQCCYTMVGGSKGYFDVYGTPLSPPEPPEVTLVVYDPYGQEVALEEFDEEDLTTRAYYDAGL